MIVNRHILHCLCKAECCCLPTLYLSDFCPSGVSVTLCLRSVCIQTLVIYWSILVGVSHFHACLYHSDCDNNNNNNHFTALCLGLPRVSRYQKKHSPTHHPDHHPVFISFFHLPRFIASSLFKLRAWQSFCTTSFNVLFGLPLGLEPSTSYSIHFFTQSVSSFHSTCPCHHNLFCCRINIMSSIPSLSLTRVVSKNISKTQISKQLQYCGCYISVRAVLSLFHGLRGLPVGRNHL